jgi:hypothetical protein
MRGLVGGVLLYLYALDQGLVFLPQAVPSVLSRECVFGK